METTYMAGHRRPDGLTGTASHGQHKCEMRHYGGKLLTKTNLAQPCRAEQSLLWPARCCCLCPVAKRPVMHYGMVRVRLAV